MFNRYWRSYPWGLRLALALLLVFTLISFTTYLTLVLGPRLAGFSMRELAKLTTDSPQPRIRVGLIVQGLTSIGWFAAPAICFAIFTHPRPRTYLGLRPPGKWSHLVFVTGIMLGLMPAQIVAQEWVFSHIDMGAAAKAQQAASTAVNAALLSYRGPGSLALILCIAAVLPAIGEELLFRGVFLRLFHQFFKMRRGFLIAADATEIQPDINRSMLMPVLVSSVMFTSMHSGPYGFAFIFIAGCVLALIYQLTGSLLMSIWAHFVYNSSQILMSYYNFPRGDGNLPAWSGLAGLGLFLLAFYALVRTQRPLHPDWSSDFLPGEDR